MEIEVAMNMLTRLAINIVAKKAPWVFTLPETPIMVEIIYL